MDFLYTEKLWCKPCYNSGLGRLIPSPKVNEKDKLYCRNCGKSYDISDIDKQQEQNKLKLQQNEGPPNLFVISQKSKNKKNRPKFESVNNDLSQEDLDDLRNMGYRI